VKSSLTSFAGTLLHLSKPKRIRENIENRLWQETRIGKKLPDDFDFSSGDGDDEEAILGTTASNSNSNRRTNNGNDLYNSDRNNANKLIEIDDVLKYANEIKKRQLRSTDQMNDKLSSNEKRKGRKEELEDDDEEEGGVFDEATEKALAQLDGNDQSPSTKDINEASMKRKESSSQSSMEMSKSSSWKEKYQYLTEPERNPSSSEIQSDLDEYELDDNKGLEKYEKKFGILPPADDQGQEQEQPQEPIELLNEKAYKSKNSKRNEKNKPMTTIAQTIKQQEDKKIDDLLNDFF
jgi:hypothetical protein